MTLRLSLNYQVTNLLCKIFSIKFWRRKMWIHTSDRQCLSLSDGYMHTHNQGPSMNRVVVTIALTALLHYKIQFTKQWHGHLLTLVPFSCDHRL